MTHKAMLVFCILFLNSATAQNITIGYATTPPYFIPPNAQGLGNKIVRRVFEELPDYTLSFVHMSIKRVHIELEAGRIDGGTNIFLPTSACLVNDVFKWQDGMITMKSRKLQINSVSELANYSVVSFHGAKNFIGGEFKFMAENNPEYIEFADENHLIQMLMLGRADVYVGDRFVFYHQLLSLGGNIDNYKYTNMFQGYSAMGVNNKRLCHEFHDAFQRLRSAGVIDKIYDEYQEQTLSELKAISGTR